MTEPSRFDLVNRNERNVYVDVYRVLIGGMLLSTIFFTFGIVLALSHPRYVPLTPEWIRRHYSWYAVVHGLATASPGTLMMLGTILLILTPVARVAVSVYVFYIDRDRKFVVVTSIVFLVMALTVVLSHFGVK